MDPMGHETPSNSEITMKLRKFRIQELPQEFRWRGYGCPGECPYARTKDGRVLMRKRWKKVCWEVFLSCWGHARDEIAILLPKTDSEFAPEKNGKKGPNHHF